MKTRLVLPFVLLLLALLMLTGAASASSEKYQPLPTRPSCSPSPTQALPENAPCTAYGSAETVPAGSSGYSIVGVRTVISGDGRVRTTRYRGPVSVYQMTWSPAPGGPARTDSLVPVPEYWLGRESGLVYEQWGVLDRKGTLSRFPLWADTSLRLAQHVRVQQLSGGVRITGELPAIGQVLAPAKLTDRNHQWPPVPDSRVWVSSTGRCRHFTFTLKTSQFKDGSEDIFDLTAPTAIRASTLGTPSSNGVPPAGLDAKDVFERGPLRIKSERVVLPNTNTVFNITRKGTHLIVRQYVRLWYVR